jgi:RNA-directed DNA polymerase
MLDAYISNRAVMNLLSQYMRRCICDGGNFLEIERGISLGCPLSPLMVEFFLHELDQAFEHGDVLYVRFMDDILILAPSRWKLRRAVATLNTILTRLRLQKRPAKTFIGRLAKRFDFLGYHFVDGVLCAAQPRPARCMRLRPGFMRKMGIGINLHPLGSISHAGTHGSEVV